MRAVALLALVVAARLQDVDRLVRDLGDESCDLREAAHAKLAAMGEAARVALGSATSHADAEVRTRASQLYAELERLAAERRQDEEARRGLLPPIEGDRSGPNWVRDEGVRFNFATRAHGEGTVIETTFRLEPKIEVDFDIDSVRDAGGREVAAERCDACSPRLVFVRATGPFEVRVAATRRWYSEYPLVFEAPANGQRKRVGDFTLEVEWPSLKLTASREYPSEELERACATFTYELLPGARRNLICRGGTARGIDAEVEKPGWCACTSGPQEWVERKIVMAKERAVPGGIASHRIAQVARIRCVVRKPFLEAIRLTVAVK